MKAHTIKSEKDYNLALVEVEKLWGAPVDTIEGDKLDELIRQIEDYESKHYSIDPPSTEVRKNMK